MSICSKSFSFSKEGRRRGKKGKCRRKKLICRGKNWIRVGGRCKWKLLEELHKVILKNIGSKGKNNGRGHIIKWKIFRKGGRRGR